MKEGGADLLARSVHTGMAKNKRQPYSVSEKAGHQTSAESWGTGQCNISPPMNLAIVKLQHGSMESIIYSKKDSWLICSCFRSRCRSYSACFRFRNPPRWASRFWQHVSFGTHVRSYKGLAQMASEDQPWPEVCLTTPVSIQPTATSNIATRN